MNARLLPTICLLCCAACGPGQPQTTAQETQPTIPRRYYDRTDTPAPTRHTPKANYKTNVQEDNKIHIAFARGESAITLHGHLGKPGTPVVCYIEMNANQTLRASVAGAAGPANIRFTRIMLPGGQSDGPFGSTLTYNTEQQGIYQLEIGTNLMADGAYEGEFVLKVQVK